MTYIIVLCIAFLVCCAVLGATRVGELLTWRRCDRREGGPRSHHRPAFGDGTSESGWSGRMHGRRSDFAADPEVHRGERFGVRTHFAVRLPLWVATLGIAVCITTIGVAVGMRESDGELTVPHMIALTPLFVAGAVMTLTPSAGFYDIAADRRGAGCLTFRRFYVLRWRVPLDDVRYCLMRGGTMQLHIPGRARPFSADQSMHGYGRLLGLMARNNVPIFWESLPYEGQSAA